MTALLLPFSLLIIGFILLVWSADKFVLGASNVARNFSIPPLIVGIVIVGLGTSAPEMLISSIAALDGKTAISIGNAIGSNITNIGLMLAIALFFYPMEIHSKLLKREIPLLLIVMVISFALLWDEHLGFYDGVVLFSLMVALLFFAVWEAKSHKDDNLSQEILNEIPDAISKRAAVVWLIVGAVVLLASSRVLVWAAVSIAEYYEISELIIGLTVIAIGTSLPELAATIASARKKEFDLAIGNIIGSNIFNILGVMALPGLLNPADIDPIVLVRDYPVMILMTACLLIFSISFRRENPIVLGRFVSLVLLTIYLAYSFKLFANVIF